MTSRLAAVFLLPFLAFSTPAFAIVVTDQDAGKHVGQLVTVKGKVARVSTPASGNTYVNFGAPHPHQTFAAVIPRKLADQFKNVKEWEGKVVSVNGMVKVYRNKPEIVLDGPAQVTVEE
jgi:DNA/RNA endonuclease YhcR with UshA esterase domain